MDAIDEGMKTISPGPRAPPCTRPRRNITARSYCLTTRADIARPASTTTRSATTTKMTMSSLQTGQSETGSGTASP